MGMTTLYQIAGVSSLVVYSLALAAVTLYCIMQFHLLYYYKKYKGKSIGSSKAIKDQDLPFVTVQLPIYNELYVVNRLIDSICSLDYPSDKLEIQVLDDSTDKTVDIIAQIVTQKKKDGHDISHIRRKDRKGYKAGALKSATPTAKGEFIAIFDADFLPDSQFLKNTINHFSDPKVGVVQTRWEHLNQNYSLLTRVQAFQLNVHFTVEQLGRHAGDLLCQFNGTAGIWRKSTIEDAGGWEADTLTEDLDLSYRAQLKDWQIIYLEDIVSPAELPAEINGLKSQQYRWMKGGAETAKKVLPKVWKSDLSLRQKVHASAHLLGSSVFLAVFSIGFFSVPLMFFIGPVNIDLSYYAIFIVGLASIVVIYYVANVQKAWQDEPWLRNVIKFFVLFPVFLALSMALSFHNSLAVIQGYLGKKSPFVRTPKFDISNIGENLVNKTYFSRKLNKVSLWEGFLFLYFAVALYCSIQMKVYAFLGLHVLLVFGYGLLFYFSVRQVVSR